MSSVNTTISSAFCACTTKYRKKNKIHAKSGVKFLVSTKIYFPGLISFHFCQKCFLHALCLKSFAFYNEKRLFQGKFRQKSFIMQTQIFIYNFSGFIFDSTKVEKICFDWKGFWTHHFMRMSVVRRCAFLIIWTIPIWFLFQWLQKKVFIPLQCNRKRVSLACARVLLTNGACWTGPMPDGPGRSDAESGLWRVPLDELPSKAEV